jgi:hypothetical protein
LEFDDNNNVYHRMSMNLKGKNSTSLALEESVREVLKAASILRPFAELGTAIRGITIKAYFPKY